MNKLTKIIGVLAILCGLTATQSIADSSDFAGPYIGLTGAAVGIELDGSHTKGNDAVGNKVNKTSGKVGAVAGIVGAQVGYAIPIGDSFLIDVGVSMNTGEAEIKSSTDDTSATADVKFTVSDLVSAWIAPTWAASDTASVYIKIGTLEADTKASGDVTAPASLKGEFVALGTRSLLGGGMYISTEAGIQQYNNLSVTGKGEGGAGTLISTTTKISADPMIAYGQVAIGYKF